MECGCRGRVNDGCAVECLKSGNTSVIDKLVRLLNICFVTSTVLVD